MTYANSDPVVACLSAYDEALVRELAGTDQLRIRIASGSGDRDELHELVRDADLVIADAARRYLLDRDAIAAMKQCRFIQQPAVGYDSIDVAQAAAQGIPVANTPGANAPAVADWVLMAILNVLRNRTGLANELGALRVGLVGMGAVAREVSKRARGFGAEVMYVARRPLDVPNARAVPLDTVLAEADVISLHLPLTADTRGMFGAAEFKRMKPGAILVNSARGGLLDTDALIAGLREGRPAAAALDVFDPEPLDPASPLHDLSNVYLTPHIAANSHQSRARVRAMVGENLRLVLAGEAPLNVVNSVS
ncbi:2-hydroxyacid dehydrogenase [Kribbella solani]|uniref:D-3-phosphoglycerate dehydrogenase n=1 Tax=Kribbella solani TaxID=236067 RepID=A0A841DXB9_9ACTN|nr:2-hydroxyacid dehydrogenase [Kribbella solani]MBB5980867.1 D-3-phosphoglycerate dehydrogenase [Kribbella solani]